MVSYSVVHVHGCYRIGTGKDGRREEGLHLLGKEKDDVVKGMDDIEGR